MAIANPTRAMEIRSRLGHPVIDADGHMSEIAPVMEDYIKRVGGQSMVDGWNRYMGGPRSGSVVDNFYSAGWETMTWEERKLAGTAAPHWWFLPTENTIDRATAFIPK